MYIHFSCRQSANIRTIKVQTARPKWNLHWNIKNQPRSDSPFLTAAASFRPSPVAQRKSASIVVPWSEGNCKRGNNRIVVRWDVRNQEFIILGHGLTDGVRDGVFKAQAKLTRLCRPNSFYVWVEALLLICILPSTMAAAPWNSIDQLPLSNLSLFLVPPPAQPLLLCDDQLWQVFPPLPPLHSFGTKILQMSILTSFDSFFLSRVTR